MSTALNFIRYTAAGILLLAGVVSASSDAEKYYTIRNHIGGGVTDVIKSAKEISASGKIIKIDGVCYSACVYFLMENLGNKVCATENAIIGIHGSYLVNDSGIVYSKEAVIISENEMEFLLNNLPEKLAEHFTKVYIPSVYKGDDVNSLAIVKGKEAEELVGPCN